MVRGLGLQDDCNPRGISGDRMVPEIPNPFTPSRRAAILRWGGNSVIFRSQILIL